MNRVEQHAQVNVWCGRNRGAKMPPDVAKILSPLHVLVAHSMEELLLCLTIDTARLQASNLITTWQVKGNRKGPTLADSHNPSRHYDFLTECFRGRHWRGGNFIFQVPVKHQYDLFYLKTRNPVKGTPWSTAWFSGWSWWFVTLCGFFGLFFLPSCLRVVWERKFQTPYKILPYHWIHHCLHLVKNTSWKECSSWSCGSLWCERFARWRSGSVNTSAQMGLPLVETLACTRRLIPPLSKCCSYQKNLQEPHGLSPDHFSIESFLGSGKNPPARLWKGAFQNGSYLSKCQWNHLRGSRRSLR